VARSFRISRRAWRVGTHREGYRYRCRASWTVVRIGDDAARGSLHSIRSGTEAGSDSPPSVEVVLPNAGDVAGRRGGMQVQRRTIGFLFRRDAMPRPARY